MINQYIREAFECFCSYFMKREGSFKNFGCHLLSLIMLRISAPLICIGREFRMQLSSYVRDLRPCVVVLAFSITVLLVFNIEHFLDIHQCHLVDRIISFHIRSSSCLDSQRAHITTFRQQLLIFFQDHSQQVFLYPL